jgi:hypothetical protein
VVAMIEGLALAMTEGGASVYEHAGALTL